ncbi:beta-ketoacyl-[acyl-carrier-protein] synthase family protein [Geofilum rhodophaeum]|uniref:beta-ketoacyl-[acyl-carrier-protein] synthase family protein n=1 Tax=Geofilum rhodophaeum TaxID=1965019 RepID=UPI000B52582B|nr:beta-ketoacyl-[acyl-carrier-protein] synthase family protein [Geofilum rhodophaeum]
MAQQIVVSGLGIISAIGNSVAENLAALKAGRSGIGPAEHLASRRKSDFMLGEVKLSNADLMKMLEVDPEEASKHSRTSLLALAAAGEACRDAGLDLWDGDRGRLALVSATTVGGMDKTERGFARRDQDASFIHTHPSGDATNLVAAYLQLLGYRTTLSTACSSAANALMHGFRLIQNGLADKVVAGGVDALSVFTLNGFNALMILDQEWCRPFDEHRKGLNLGEGAGFLVLESAESAAERKAKVYGRLSGFANSNDAFHQTASSPEGDGATAAMEAALRKAGLQAGDIDYINAHGTGTANNDLSEGKALKRVFGAQVPPFASTKAYTGHTLGAAAGIEAVCSVLALEQGLLFPGLNFKTPIPDLDLQPLTELKASPGIQHVLSNSFGFGGNCSTLIFSK